MATSAPFDVGTFIESDPGYWGGRPFIRGKRVTVHRIAILHAQGREPVQLADDLDLELAEVHAALAYYFANRDQIDRDIDAFDAESLRIAEDWIKPRPH